MNTKWQRALAEMAREEGLEVEAIDTGKHLKLKLRNKAGQRSTYFASLTPSDHRAILNIRAYFRRFARGA